MGGLVGGNIGGIPGYIMLVFPKVMTKLARYPRLAKLLSFALTLAVASYLNFSMVTGAMSTAWHYFIQLFTSSITVSGQDPIVDDVQSWLRKVRTFTGTSLKGESSYFIKKREGDNDYDDWEYDDDGNRMQKDEDEQTFRMILHSKHNMQLFRHQGRYFLVSKEGGDSLYNPASVDSITFYCFGWSPKPITELLTEIDKSKKVVQQERWTTIRTHEEDRYASWSRPQTKLARPISSVDLNEGDKEMIVNDVAEYLAPETKVCSSACTV